MFKSTLLALVALALLATGQAASGRTDLATMDVLLETFWSSTARGETVSLLLNSNKGETSAIFKLGTTALTVGQGECSSDADCPAKDPVCSEYGYCQCATYVPGGPACWTTVEGAATTSADAPRDLSSSYQPVRRWRRSATASQEECSSDADCPAEVPVCSEDGYCTAGDRRRRSATDTTNTTTTTTGDRRRRSAADTTGSTTTTTTTTTGDRRRRSAADTTGSTTTTTTTTTTGRRRRRSADYLEKIVCEDKKSTFECPGDKRIEVSSAVYGRNDWDTCKGPWDWAWDWDTDCGAEATTLVKDLCDGKKTCSIHAANTGSQHTADTGSVSTWIRDGEGSAPGYCTGSGCDGAVWGGAGTITQAVRGEWGDPCPYTLKYMEVLYTCT